MKIEIIQNPSGSFAIYNGDTLLSDGWRTKDDAEMQAAGHARRIAAAALGSAKTPAKAAAARENGRKGGRPVAVYLHAVSGGWTWSTSAEFDPAAYDGAVFATIDGAEGAARRNHPTARVVK